MDDCCTLQGVLDRGFVFFLLFFFFFLFFFPFFCVDFCRTSEGVEWCRKVADIAFVSRCRTWGTDFLAKLFLCLFSRRL